MEKELKKKIREALAEDKSQQDITSHLLIPPEKKIRAVIIAKKGGVVAGLPVTKAVFKEVDRRISFLPQVTEGAEVRPGRILAKVSGPARGILAGERTALNFLRRLSGIATFTQHLVKKTKKWGVKIYDTRKTSPGLRELEKYAVRTGGGYSHRKDLAAAILIKDNHLKISGGIKKALEVLDQQTARKGKGRIFWEVEVTSLSQLEEALKRKAPAIMLDNMSFDQLKKAVRLIRAKQPKTIVEVSGIYPPQVERIARLKVDRISLGTLTHSAPALDISLEVVSSQ